MFGAACVKNWFELAVGLSHEETEFDVVSIWFILAFGDSGERPRGLVRCYDRHWNISFEVRHSTLSL